MVVSGYTSNSCCWQGAFSTRSRRCSTKSSHNSHLAEKAIHLYQEKTTKPKKLITAQDRVWDLRVCATHVLSVPYFCVDQFIVVLKWETHFSRFRENIKVSPFLSPSGLWWFGLQGSSFGDFIPEIGSLCRSVSNSLWICNVVVELCKNHAATALLSLDPHCLPRSH